MKLTALNRLKLFFEILTIRSGHPHISTEKQISTFIRGYEAGRKDEKFACKYAREIKYVVAPSLSNAGLAACAEN